MPFVVICPECNAQLKSNAFVPAGRTIACPSCKTKFTTERDSKEVGGGGSKASVSVPPAPPPPKPKAKPSRDEEDDFDFDDDRPKKKAKATRDEDDFDDDDDRPKKKVSKNRDYDDEDDDQPRKKSSKNRDYDDEDDEDERPHSKKKGKKKKQQKSKLPWILGLAGGGVVALLGILTLILFLTDTYPFSKKDKNVVNNNPPPGGGPNNPNNPGGGQTGNAILDAMRYVPNNVNSVVFIDVEKMRADPVLAPIANKMADSFSFFILNSADIARVGIFGSDKGIEPVAVIIQLKSSFNRAAFDQKIAKQPSTINGVQVYSNDKGIIYFGDPSTIVIGEQNVHSPILGKPQTANTALQEFAQTATGAFSMFTAKPDPADGFGDFTAALNIISGPKGGQPTNPQRISLTAGIKQSSVEVTESQYYSSEAVAKSEHQMLVTKLNAAKQNQAMILMRVQSGQLATKLKPDQLKMMLETGKVTQSGTKVTITYSQPKTAELFEDF